jgi:hypothetical protein
MTDIEQRARELLAAEYERDVLPEQAAYIRGGGVFADQKALRAIAAALREAPEGFVMVPVADLAQTRCVVAKAWHASRVGSEADMALGKLVAAFDAAIDQARGKENENG